MRRGLQGGLFMAFAWPCAHVPYGRHLIQPQMLLCSDCGRIQNLSAFAVYLTGQAAPTSLQEKGQLSPGLGVPLPSTCKGRHEETPRPLGSLNTDVPSRNHTGL